MIVFLWLQEFERKNIYLFSTLCVIEFFEELHFHGIADLIVLVREEVEEGGEDAFAKENDQQVEGKNKGGKSSKVEEEQGEKSDFEIHVWNLKLLAEWEYDTLMRAFRVLSEPV